MNWFKVIGNVLGAAAACFAAHSVMAGGVSTAVTTQTLILVAVCIASNLVGLFQAPPHA